MQDQRGAMRRKTYLGATATFPHWPSMTPCVVRNMGDGGARLRFAEPVMPSHEFELRIPHLQRSYKARLAWQHGLDIGVVLVESGGLSPLQPEGQVVLH